MYGLSPSQAISSPAQVSQNSNYSLFFISPSVTIQRLISPVMSRRCDKWAFTPVYSRMPRKSWFSLTVRCNCRLHSPAYWFSLTAWCTRYFSSKRDVPTSKYVLVSQTCLKPNNSAANITRLLFIVPLTQDIGQERYQPSYLTGLHCVKYRKVLINIQKYCFRF